MKIAYVVQRFGPDIYGGAEAHCRAFAHRVADRGWDVEVFTTCATDYRTWRNVLPAGTETEGKVAVHRFPSATERPADFDEFCNEVLADPEGSLPDLQERWMEAQGPQVPDLVEALRAEHSRFDLVVFVTYLYYTTQRGITAVPDRAVLHPTAHDEPPIHLSMFDETFRIPKGFVFYTDDERNFVHERFEIGTVPQLVSGIGVEAPGQYDRERGWQRAGVDSPYVVYFGRIDPSKGVEHLFEFFSTYRERHNRDVKLVLAGDQVIDVPQNDSIVRAGRLTDEEKWDVLAGAELLVHPSFFESFAMSLMESWRVGVPAVVNGYNDVMVGHCRRADGGVWYRSYAEFEACLDTLLDDADTRRMLGEQGRRYVEAQYEWDHVIDRYVDFLTRVREGLRL